MKSTDDRKLFTTLIGADAAAGDIVVIPATQATAGDGTASIADGFPAETFISTSAGGKRPRGQDVNGFLNLLSDAARVLQAENFGPYSSALSAAIGGYPLNAVVSAGTAGAFWVSTVEDNTTVPGNAGASWQSLFAGLAPLASPAFTGVPTVPTPTAGANNTQAANTAWVDAYFAALNGSSSEAFNVANAFTSTEAVALGQIPSLTPGRLIDIKIFGSSTTYTSTSGTNSVVIMALGGGGAGAGASATNSSQQSAGGGGSAGAFAWARYTSALSGIAITIGAGGGGGTSLTGAAGGTTTVAGYLSCPGGPGGVNPGSNAPGGFGGDGGISGAPSGYNILGYPGDRGRSQSTVGLSLTPTGGQGGNTIFGTGGAPGAAANGSGASGYGAGGGGASVGTSSGTAVGGSGTGGVVIIWEYA